MKFRIGVVKLRKGVVGSWQLAVGSWKGSRLVRCVVLLIQYIGADSSKHPAMYWRSDRSFSETDFAQAFIQENARGNVLVLFGVFRIDTGWEAAEVHP